MTHMEGLHPGSTPAYLNAKEYVGIDVLEPQYMELLKIPAHTVNGVRHETQPGPQLDHWTIKSGDGRRYYPHNFPYRTLVDMDRGHGPAVRFVRVGWNEKVGITIPLLTFMRTFGCRFKESYERSDPPAGVAEHFAKWNAYFCRDYKDQGYSDAMTLRLLRNKEVVRVNWDQGR